MGSPPLSKRSTVEPFTRTMSSLPSSSQSKTPAPPLMESRTYRASGAAMWEAVTPSSLAISLNTGTGGSTLWSALGLDFAPGGGTGTRGGPAACAKTRRGASRKRASTIRLGARKRVEFIRRRRRGFVYSLRFGFRLRRSQDQRLVVFKRAPTEILRARQRFLREFGLAKLPVR